jgi:hypothetical protein
LKYTCFQKQDSYEGIVSAERMYLNIEWRRWAEILRINHRWHKECLLLFCSCCYRHRRIAFRPF